MTEPRELGRFWQAVLGRLEMDMSPQTFSTWLRGTRPLRMDGETLVVEARSSLNSDWLNERLGVVVHRAVANVLGDEMPVRFVPPGFDDQAPTRGGAEPQQGSTQVVGNLNRAYRFESYITGVGNRLAYECCTSLVESGDWRVNPVVVYGAPGMGKTHLLHALAHRAAGEGWAVTCLSAEEFTTRYQTALRRKDTEEFQATLREAKLLIIDDLQYLAGKKATQAELVSTIDAVVNAGGFVVCGSELHPLDIDLPQRLASRLAQGIVTRVDPFLADERRTFVELQSRERRMALPDWAVERIAQCEMPSVRVLQGTVNAAVALAQRGLLDPRRLDAELTRVAVADACPGALEDRAMLSAIAKHFETSLAELVGRSRKGPVAQARAVAAAKLKGRGRSLGEIAKTLGGRDPSTVSGLAERGAELLAADGELRRIAG